MGGREFGGLNTAQAVGADGGVLDIVVEEVKDPGRGFRDVAARTGFGDGHVVEGVGGLEIGGRQLCVVEAFMHSGQEFEGETEPGLPGEDSVGGIEGGREGLTDPSETMKCDAGRVGVRDIVMVEGVGDDDGCRAFIARKTGAKVSEWKEVHREARVQKSKEVVKRVGIAHDKEDGESNVKSRKVVQKGKCSERQRDRE